MRIIYLFVIFLRGSKGCKCLPGFRRLDLEFSCQYIKEISSKTQVQEPKFVELLEDRVCGLDLASQALKNSPPWLPV